MKIKTKVKAGTDEWTSVNKCINGTIHAKGPDGEWVDTGQTC